MEDRNTFKVVIDGEEIEYEVLYTFYSIKTGNNYIIYTDNKNGSDGKINMFASIFYPNEKDRELEDIEKDEDWNEVESFLERISE
jgi:uncharacterized protein YrzB (UPF0473 family)